jgi:hypothetical protein
MRNRDVSTLLFAAAVLMAGCGSDIKLIRQSASRPAKGIPAAAPGSQSSPRALLTALNDAQVAGDYEAMLALMEPPAREKFRQVLDWSRGYTDALEQTTRVIADRINGKLARQFRRQAFMGMLTSPLGEAAAGGKINWRKVSIRISGDTAVARSSTRPSQPVDMVSIGGAWRLSRQYYLANLPPSGILWYKKTFDDAKHKLSELRKDVEAGLLNEKNFKRRVLEGKPAGKDGGYPGPTGPRGFPD